MIDILIRRVNLEIDINMQRTSCEHEGRDQGATPTSKGTAKIASKPPDPRTQTWGRLAPGTFGGRKTETALQTRKTS